MTQMQTATENDRPWLSALLDELSSLSALLARLSDKAYRQGAQGKSPIGGHVRHLLDHFHALLAGIDSGIVDYEQRQRGAAVEQDRALAISQVQALATELAACSAERLQRPVQVRVMITADGQVAYCASTVGRELLFLLSHQHHHHALIADMAQWQGVSVDPLFALAPSTRAAVLTEQS